MNEKSVFPFKKVRTDICSKYKECEEDRWECVYYKDKTCSEWENCPHNTNGDDNTKLVCKIENEIQNLAFSYLCKIEGLQFTVWYYDEDWRFDIYVGEVNERKDKHLIEKVENVIQELFNSRKWKNYLKKHNAVITNVKFDKRRVFNNHLSYRVWWKKEKDMKTVKWD